MFLFFLILCFIHTGYSDAAEPSYIPTDWVDPTDMRHYDHHTKSMKSTDSKFLKHNLQCLSDGGFLASVLEDLQKYKTFMTRFINLILYTARLEVNSVELAQNETIERTIKILTSGKLLHQLKTLVNNSKSSDLPELDRIMSNMIQIDFRANYDTKSAFSSIILALNKWGFWLSSSCIFVTLTFLATLWIFLVEKNISKALIFLFLMFYLSGLVWTWFKMYEEKSAERISYLQVTSNIADVCNVSKVSFWSWRYYFGSLREECKEYYEQVFIDPLMKVSPSLVISETTATMIIHPLKALGHGIGDFIKGISNSAPWPLNIIFLPVIFIFLLFSVLLTFGMNIHMWTLVGGLKFGRERIQTSTEYQRIRNEEDLGIALQSSKSDNVLINRRILSSFFSKVTISEQQKQLLSNSESGQGDFSLRNHLLPSAYPYNSARTEFRFHRESSEEPQQSEIRVLASLCRILPTTRLKFHKRKSAIQKSKYKFL